jgi:hypothetical protein
MIGIEDRADMANSAAKRAKRAAASDSVTRVCLTIDDKTMAIVNQLQWVTGLDRAKTVRTVLEAARTGEIKAKELFEFYRSTWLLLASDTGNKVMARFDWPAEQDETLLLLSRQIFGRPNRSEMFRILVSYYAVKHDVVKIAWVKAAKLEVAELGPKRISSK